MSQQLKRMEDLVNMLNIARFEFEQKNESNLTNKQYDTYYDELVLLENLLGRKLPNSPTLKGENKMKKVIEIIKELQSVSGRKDKESILESNKHNETLKNLLGFVYNPYILTGLSTKKIAKKLPKIDEKPLDFADLLQYIAKNCTGRDIDIQVVQNFLNSLDDDREFYEEVLTKSLKIGCTAKTLNKIYGEDFIPTFGVMLAEKYFDNVEKVEGKEFTITMKRDGNRCIFVKEDGTVKAFTRQGQSYEGLVDLENELMSLPIDNIVLDGELMVLNDNEIDSSEQFKSTMKIVRKDGEKHGVKLVVFDYIILEDFKKGKCDTPYVVRRNTLEEIFSSCSFFEPVKKLYEGNDIGMIQSILDEVTSNGEEGVMINLNDAPYECKRVKTLLKVKKFQTVDLKVVGVQEGEGKYKGTTGAIVVEYKGNTVAVGTGLSDVDREHFWNNKEVIGKIVEIKYFEESTNQKDDKLSLRFPVYVRIRNDKSEESLF